MARKTTKRKATTSKSKTTTAAKPAATRKVAPKVTTARKTVKIAPKTPVVAAAEEAEEAKVATQVNTAPTEDLATDQDIVDEDEQDTETTLRKLALVNAVTERSGVKRRDAKASVEAALEILGEAIADGRGINLPGFGKLKVVRTKKFANAHLYVTRIRQTDRRANDPDDGGRDPLAEAAE